MFFSRSWSKPYQSESEHSNSTPRSASPVGVGAQIDDVDSSSSVKERPPPMKVWSTIMKIVDAIYTIDDEMGSSPLAIRNYIATTSTANVSPALLKGYIRTALKKGLDEGILIRPKGTKSTGVTGRYCLGFIKSTGEGKSGRDGRSGRGGKRGSCNRSCRRPKGRGKGRKRSKRRTSSRRGGSRRNSGCKSKSRKRSSSRTGSRGRKRSKRSKSRSQGKSKGLSKSRCKSRKGAGRSQAQESSGSGSSKCGSRWRKRRSTHDDDQGPKETKQKKFKTDKGEEDGKNEGSGNSAGSCF
ncbi:protein B4-like [Gigantopelta aegis]|uniref:protein B4-like n=1 Tax=Gigantopelta aegis TaxID=1735272 RepID=UPI001B88DA0E|nr:protein B4-like [Gigantopelta aegis]